jgi:hypothetical protein
MVLGTAACVTSACSCAPATPESTAEIEADAPKTREPEPYTRGIQDVTKEDLRAWLLWQYSIEDAIGTNRIWFNDAPIEDVSQAALNGALPHVRFFKTKFQTPYYEYRQVGTLLAVQANAGKLQITKCCSPDYSQLDSRFLELLNGAKATSEDDRKKLGAEISGMLASIVYRGVISEEGFDGENFSALILIVESRPFARVTVAFDGEGVTSVKLSNGVVPED